MIRNDYALTPINENKHIVIRTDIYNSPIVRHFYFYLDSFQRFLVLQIVSNII
jgi:hypothetical protein